MDVLDSPTLDVKMSKLRKDVDPYQVETERVSSSSKPFRFQFYHTYIIIPVVIFVLLGLMQPSVVRTTKVDEEGFESKSLDFQKLLMWTLLIGGVIDVVLFAYKYKKQTVKN